MTLEGTLSQDSICSNLPANNAAAIQIISSVIEVLEALRALETDNRMRALAVITNVISTDDSRPVDLDDAYGMLDQILLERRAAAERSRSTDGRAGSAGPKAPRSTTSQE